MIGKGKKPAAKPAQPRKAKKNTFLTKSGTAIKLNRSLGERLKTAREARVKRKAAYLATLPKNRFKRILFQINPKNAAKYWFSRDGALMALKIMGVAIVIGFVLIVGVFAYFRKDLPNIKDLTAQNLGGSMTYYDRTESVILWQDYVDIMRVPVATEDMSKHIRNATVAIEDKDFYTHGAFDIRGIFRAAINNVFGGGATQGGSTISMQYAKIDQGNTANRTFGNKVKELILSIEMEREYSKDDILTGYLNAVPYGPMSVGVQVAAQEYFGVDAKDLTVAQSAFLAAIPQSPSLYSPYGPRYDAGALVGRMLYIIDLMREQGYITEEEANEAKSTDILATVKPQRPSLYTGIKAPHFVLSAKEELMERYGDATIKRGGWKVVTTVDMSLQELAEKAVTDGMKQVRAQTPQRCTDTHGLSCRDGATAAFVAIDNETGQVVALVGNGDHPITDDNIGELNFGSKLFISPGSTFKPYDYGVFIENNNAGAGSVLYDSYGALPGYPCANNNPGSGSCLRDYDWTRQSPPGPITIRYSLGGSRNIPAVKAMLSSVPNDTSPGRVASINKTISTAEAMMGANEDEPKKYWCFVPNTDVYTASVNADYRRENQTQCGGSSAIGDGAYVKLDDHASGIATFARMGQQIPHTYILKITDASNKIVYEYKQPTPKQVLRPDTAYIINDMAADPAASYMGNNFHRVAANNGWAFALKTGTTNDSYDGLLAGWSTKYTALTWVGHYTRTVAMTGVMETMTRPIVRDWMQGAHKDIPPKYWEKPSGVKTLPAYVITKKVSQFAERIPSRDTDLYPSWYQQPSGDTSVTIDLVSNKTATECTPELARSTSGGAGGNHNLFSADVFVGVPGSGGQQSSDSVDDVHNCNDAKPEVFLTNNCFSASDCTFTVTVTRGTHQLPRGTYTANPAGTISLTVNGKTKTYVIPEDATGSVWTHNFEDIFDEFEIDNSVDELTAQVGVVDSVLYSGQSNQVNASL